ncbi:unnamed protein product [Phytophthora fragariaefolia]|uniref:Unnamed protein product n=1 Tax=Phytophthora fragariaefolia TaxID=1490495 RepID=A0A9W6YHB0_9STRA|nr:unnamed protein product [Phytophthora fragariaefolia]
MDFVFGLPPDAAGNTGVVVFVDRLSKMAHLAAVPDTIEGEGTASLFLDRVFRQHGVPEAVVSDRDPVLDVHLLGAWHSLGHVHRGSSADRRSDETRQPRCRGCPPQHLRWSVMLPLFVFALNNAVQTSTGYTPFYVNGLSHPCVPLTPPRPGSGLSGGEGFVERLADISPLAVRKQVDTILSTRLSVLRQVRDAMTEIQDNQKEHADA